MTVEIKVGPPVITISQGRTFMVTTQAGEILPNSDQVALDNWQRDSDDRAIDKGHA